MLTVTPSARKKLYNMLRGGRTKETSLRLAVSPDQKLGLVLDKHSGNDQIVEYRGVKVLLVDRDILPWLDRVTIDTREEDGNPVLTIDKAPSR